MIDKIYEVVADKTLTFWCVVSVSDWENTYLKTVVSKSNDTIQITWLDWPVSVKHWDKIIWCPVMIWDIMDWMERLARDENWERKADNTIPVDWPNLIMKRFYKRKPIENQPIECILFVYSLIKWK